MSPRQTIEAQIFYKTPQSYIIASWPEQAQGSPVIAAEICVAACWSLQYCRADNLLGSRYLLICWDGGDWILTQGRKLVRFQAAVSPTLKISELFISILIDVKPIKTYSACVLPVGCSQTYSCKTTYASCWHQGIEFARLAFSFASQFPLWREKTKVVLDNSNQLVADLEFMIPTSGLNGTLLTSWTRRISLYNVSRIRPIQTLGNMFPGDRNCDPLSMPIWPFSSIKSPFHRSNRV